MNTPIKAVILSLLMAASTQAAMNTENLSLICTGDLVNGMPQQYVVNVEQEPILSTQVISSSSTNQSLMASIGRLELGEIKDAFVLTGDEFKLSQQDSVNFLITLKSGEVLSCGKEEELVAQNSKMQEFIIKKVTPSGESVGAASRAEWCAGKAQKIYSADLTTDLHIFLLGDGYYSCQGVSNNVDGRFTVQTKKCTPVAEKDICAKPIKSTSTIQNSQFDQNRLVADLIQKIGLGSGRLDLKVENGRMFLAIKNTVMKKKIELFVESLNYNKGRKIILSSRPGDKPAPGETIMKIELFIATNNNSLIFYQYKFDKLYRQPSGYIGSLGGERHYNLLPFPKSVDMSLFGCDMQLAKK